MKELTIPIICTRCKDEIPQLKELKGIKTRQAEADRLIEALRVENTEIKETMRLQGELITGLTTKFNSLEQG